MSVFEPAHPLDVDLADLVDGLLDDDAAAQAEAHIARCLVCRARHGRLGGAPTVAPSDDEPSRTATLPSPAFLVPVTEGGDEGPAPADLWLAGGDERTMVVVLGVQGGRVLVAPVTFDIEAADEETLVVEGERSPVETGVAVYPELAAEVRRDALVERLGSFGTPAALADVLTGTGAGMPGSAGAGVRRGRPSSTPPIPGSRCASTWPTACRRWGSRRSNPTAPSGPRATAQPLSLGSEEVRASLIGDLRALRGRVCTTRRLFDWGDVLLARYAGWEPVATIDEVGIVLVVLDTPHGLTDDADFHTARSVLTRFNATALVVLAGGISDLAEVFDASSLNHGIDAPSGRHTPPRPLISGLTPFDAIGKYLDQTTGVRTAAPASRGPVTRVDVGDILRHAAGDALADAVRQGSRFKIAPKRRGYESIADDREPFEAAVGRAFGSGSVVQDLLDLAPGPTTTDRSDTPHRPGELAGLSQPRPRRRSPAPPSSSPPTASARARCWRRCGGCWPRAASSTGRR